MNACLAKLASFFMRSSDHYGMNRSLLPNRNVLSSTCDACFFTRPCEHYGMNRSLYQTEMRYINIALIESQQNKT